MRKRRHDTPDHLQHLITVEEADRMIALAAAPLPTERVPIAEARGRILAEEIATDRDLPPYDRVAMDGVAIMRRSWDAGRRRYRVASIAAAGSPQAALAAEDSCVQVMTGAVLPVGAEIILPVEYLDTESNPGFAVVLPEARADDHIHRRGSDRPAGETILRPGTRLAARHIGILASIGVAEPLVSVLPKVAVTSTGDELVPVETTPEPHQIRMSNGIVIAAALAEARFSRTTVSHIPDDRQRLLAEFADQMDANDVLVIAGGVSAGEYDFVPGVLEELGMETLFHKVSQRPGKPLLFGVRQGKRRTVIFGLPGNPVSALIGTIRYVVPHLRRCCGDSEVNRIEYAQLSAEVTFRPDLTFFLPVKLSSARTDGTNRAIPAETNGSGDFAALAAADGFIELPPGQDIFAAGFVAPLYRFGGHR